MKNSKLQFKIQKYYKFAVLLSILVLLSSGCLGKPRSGETTKIYEKAAKQLEQTQTARYECEEGKTALEVLKEMYQVETKTFSGLGEFVESIGGIKAENGKNFWAFYVNGKLAEVGAGQYQCKKGESVEWKLEKINNNK